MGGDARSGRAPTTTNERRCAANTVPDERSGQDWSCCCVGSEAPSVYPDRQRILKIRAVLGQDFEIRELCTTLKKALANITVTDIERFIHLFIHLSFYSFIYQNLKG